MLQAEAPERTRQGYEATVGINHLGHFLLASLLQPRLAADGGGRWAGVRARARLRVRGTPFPSPSHPTLTRLVVTASGVHDPESPGGTVGGDPATGATLGDLSGLGAVAGGAVMADGAMAYNGAKAYHDSKLCNVLFAREADRRWRAGGVSVRSFNPGLITDTGLFRAARKDNLVGTLLFSFVATNLAGFSVPVEVAGLTPGLNQALILILNPNP